MADLADAPQDQGAPPVDPTRIKAALAFASKEFNVNQGVLAGMMMRESNMDSDVASGQRTSSAGAIGLMQFMPQTALRYGIDPTDPVQSIIGAAAYMRDNLDRFHGDYQKAIAAYNWGEDHEALNKPDWRDHMPDETANYVHFVSDFADKLNQQQGRDPVPLAFDSGLAPNEKVVPQEQPSVENVPGQAPRITLPIPLPQGVTPSNAGAGRGAVNPDNVQPGESLGDTAERMGMNAAKSLADGLYHVSRSVGLAAATPAILADKLHSWISGKDETGLQDWMFKHAVDPADNMMSAMKVDPKDAPAVADKVINGLASSAPDLAMAMATGGESIPASTMMKGGVEAIKALVMHGMESMTLPAFNQGIGKAMDLIKQGVPLPEAVRSGIVTGTATDALGGLPMSAQGSNIVSRMLQGAAVNVAGHEVQRQAENAVAAPERQQPPSAIDDAIAAASGAVLGVMPAGEAPRSDLSQPTAGERVLGEASGHTQRAAALGPDASPAERMQAVRPLKPAEEPAPGQPTPPPDPGTVRYYHGGAPEGATGSLWFTSDLNDAQGWASRSPSMGTWYVDVPADHPARGGDAQFGVLPPTRVELPAELANQRQRFVVDPEAQKAKATQDLAQASTVDDAIKAAQDLATRPSDDTHGALRALSETAGPKDLFEQAALKKIQEAIDKHSEINRTEFDEAHQAATKRVEEEVKAQQKTEDQATQHEEQTAAAKEAEKPAPPAPEPVQPRHDGYVDLTPMTAQQARDRLDQMRAELAARGGDPKTLIVARHPEKTTITDDTGRAQPAFGIRTRPPARPDTEPVPPAERAAQPAEPAEPQPAKQPTREPQPVQPPAEQPPAAQPERTPAEVLKTNDDAPALRKQVQARNMPGVIDHLAQSNNPVIQRVAQLSRNLKTQFISRRLKAGAGGGYLPQSDAIAIPPTYRGNEHALAHELTHALLFHSIEKPTPEQLPHVGRLQALRAHVMDLAKQGKYGLKPWGPNGGDYGLSPRNALHEFMAEGLTSSKFQQKLMQIPYGKTSAWSKFVSTVGKLLGINHQHTALHELLQIGENIARNGKAKGLEPHELPSDADHEAVLHMEEQPGGSAPPDEKHEPVLVQHLSPQAQAGANHPAPQGAMRAAQKSSGFLAWARGLRDNFLLGILPMSKGTPLSQAIVKKYANSERLARYQWQQFDRILKSSYSPERLKEMWEAADEHNTLLQQGLTPAETGVREGLARLTPDERATVEALHQYGEELLQRARDVGMFQGEGLPYWTPRMAVMLDEEGNYYRPPHGTNVGHDIVTTSPNLKRRKYLTAEETEAAQKALLGDNASLVRDIRTMPLAMARLERAIAGRELINSIKEAGDRIGAEFTHTRGGAPGNDWFTIDHPSFTVWQHKYVTDPNTGKSTWAKDQFGRLVYERAPLYMHKDFEGPIKSVMYARPGAMYKALTDLKSTATSLIMYSPAIHNMVIFGKALPAVNFNIPKLISLYFKGNALRKAETVRGSMDAKVMQEAISNGMTPIGRFGAKQDVTGIVADPDLVPGHGPISKAVGGTVGLVNKGAGEFVKRKLDRGGEIWHGTMLWDRVADLQMGLYWNAKQGLTKSFIKDGMSAAQADRAAGLTAAHIANRYAGALPNEAMSGAFRKISNVALFSRSFTLGNLALFKDAVSGLPVEVRAQLMQEVGNTFADKVNGTYRRQAIATVVMDIGAMYVFNSLVQSGVNMIFNDSTLSDEKKGYVRRALGLWDRMHTMPDQLLLHPWNTLHSLTPNGENEKGKENRIKGKPLSDGTATYYRSPFGKTGEDLEAWLSNPFQALWRKTGSTIRPVIEIGMQAIGSPIDGKRIWAPSDNVLQVVGKAALHFAKAQMPFDEATTVADWAAHGGNPAVSQQGQDRQFVSALKATLPMVAGVTVSKGYPGGEGNAALHEVEQRQRDEKAARLPDVNALLQTGKDEDRDKAIGIMRDQLHMDANQIRSQIKYQTAPMARFSASRLRRDAPNMTDEDRARLERAQQQR